MNKKADGKIISIYWFIILVVVAGGVFLMVSLYYSSPYDVRDIEADLLSEKIANCISYQGDLNSNLISDAGIFKEAFIDHFLDECDININPVGQWEKPQYYFEVNFYKFEDSRAIILNISEGDINFKSDCEIKDKKYENLVVCSKKEFYTRGFGENVYLIKILSVVRKTEQNVK